MTADDLFKSIDKRIDKLIKILEHETQVEYLSRRKAVLDAVRGIWDAAAIATPGKSATVGNVLYVSKAEAYKFGRMEKFEKLIAEQARISAVNDIANLQRTGVKIYTTQYNGYAWAYSQGYSLPITGGADTTLVASALYSDFSGRVFTDTVRKNLGAYADNIIASVTHGLNQGESFSKIAKSLTEVTDRAYSNALRVARTEGGRIQSQAYLDGLGLLDEIGVEYEKMWMASIDDKTREDHISMDGKMADKDGIFHLPSGATGPAPRETGNASDDINCIPEYSVPIGMETEIMYKRYYDGDLVDIKTASGSNIRITPNHPVLTDKGWVAANLIDIGDNIISVRLRGESPAREPNVQNRPPVAAKVFDLFSIAPHKRINGTDKQFHGDGEKSDVDIISIDRKLWDRFFSSVYKPLAKFNLALSDIRSPCLPANSPSNKLRFSSLNASDRIMGIFSQFASFIRASISHALIHCRRPIARNNPISNKYFSNSAPASVQRSANLFFGNAAKVFADNVVGVNTVKYSGHVYNLQTKQGWYGLYNDNGNMSVVHNCRCSALTIIGGEKPTERRVREEGIVPYETFTQRLERGGEIPMRDVVKARE